MGLKKKMGLSLRPGPYFKPRHPRALKIKMGLILRPGPYFKARRPRALKMQMGLILRPGARGPNKSKARHLKFAWRRLAAAASPLCTLVL